jgi:hypothetical protein
MQSKSVQSRVHNWQSKNMQISSTPDFSHFLNNHLSCNNTTIFNWRATRKLSTYSSSYWNLKSFLIRGLLIMQIRFINQCLIYCVFLNARNLLNEMSISGVMTRSILLKKHFTSTNKLICLHNIVNTNLYHTMSNQNIAFFLAISYGNISCQLITISLILL